MNPLSRRCFLFLALLALPVTAGAKVRVVATLPDLAAIAKEVGGDHVTIRALASPSQDPHYVDARPSYLVPLSRADLLIVNGLGLEIGWLPPLLQNARNGKIQPGAKGHLDASSVVKKLEVATTKVDPSMGDVHPGGNPHYLFDPRAAIRVAIEVARRLEQLDPDHAEAYTANVSRFVRQLTRLVREEANRFAKLPAERRRVVAYHKSFPYLFDWLGLEVVTHVEPKPGIAPSPGHVAKVLKIMKRNRVLVIVQEEFYPQRTSKTLARIARSQLAVLPGGARFTKGERYVDHLKNITRKLYAAISR